MENKISYDEFKEQDEYCRRPGQSGGHDCNGCPGEHSICADNIRDIFGKLIGGFQPQMKVIAKSNIREFHFDELTCDVAASCTADEIIELITKAKLPSQKYYLMKKEHNAYVWEVLSWSFNKEDLIRDMKGLENPDEWTVVSEEDFFGHLTEVV